MDVNKYELEDEQKAREFFDAVIASGGMAYQWYKTATVVTRGPVPEGFETRRNDHVTDFDVLMLNVSGV